MIFYRNIKYSDYKTHTVAILFSGFISLELNYICPFSSGFWHGAYGSPWNILNLNFFAIIPNLYFRKTKTSKNWFRTNVL